MAEERRRGPKDDAELAKRENRLGLIGRIKAALSAQHEVIEFNAEGELKREMRQISRDGLDAADKLHDDLRDDLEQYRRQKRRSK